MSREKAPQGKKREPKFSPGQLVKLVGDNSPVMTVKTTGHAQSDLGGLQWLVEVDWFDDNKKHCSARFREEQLIAKT